MRSLGLDSQGHAFGVGTSNGGKGVIGYGQTPRLPAGGLGEIHDFLGLVLSRRKSGLGLATRIEVHRSGQVFCQLARG
jgi:hypothetical protein